jgi:hypothetical protein
MRYLYSPAFFKEVKNMKHYIVNELAKAVNIYITIFFGVAELSERQRHFREWVMDKAYDERDYWRAIYTPLTFVNRQWKKYILQEFNNAKKNKCFTGR